MHIKHFWLVNLFIFQVSWFSTAMLRDQALWILLALLLLHFSLSPSRYSDAAVAFLAGSLGLLADGLLIFSGLLAYECQCDFIPVWMFMIWFMFSISLNHSLAWCHTLPTWGKTLLGSSAGLLTYMGAETTGALHLTTPPYSHLALFTIWGMLLPSMLYLAAFIQRKITQHYPTDQSTSP